MPTLTVEIGGRPQPYKLELGGEQLTQLRSFPVGDDENRSQQKSDELRLFRCVYLARELQIKSGNIGITRPDDTELETINKLPGSTLRAKLLGALDAALDIRARGLALYQQGIAAVKAKRERDPEAKLRRLNKIHQARRGLWVPGGNDL